MPKRKRGNGEGTISQRPDGSWMGQLTTGWDRLTGKQSRVTVYAPTAREAREKLEAAKGKAAEEAQEGADWTLHRYLEWWLLSCKHHVKPASLERYEKDVAYLLPYLKGRTLAGLAATHVTQLYQRMMRDGRSPNVCYQAGTRLRHALKGAVEGGLVKVNVAALVPLPRVTRTEIRPLHPEEVSAFLAACRARRLEALPVVAFDTGARIGELLALEWSDWSPASRELNITKTFSYRRKKEGGGEVRDCKTRASRRRVLLSASAAQCLEGHRARMVREGHGEAPVFCSRRGTYLWRSSVTVLLNYVCKEARLPHMRVHDLRHSCATLLLAAGVDIKSIAARLGHSNCKQLLSVYAHVLPTMQCHMADVMGALQGGSPRREEAPVPVLKIAEVS